MKLIVVFFSAVLFFAACAGAMGPHYNEEYARSLKPRSTLYDEARIVLGEPTVTKSLDDGTTAYRWDFVDYDPMKGNVPKAVNLLFDSNGQFLRQLPETEYQALE